MNRRERAEAILKSWPNLNMECDIDELLTSIETALLEAQRETLEEAADSIPVLECADDYETVRDWLNNLAKQSEKDTTTYKSTDSEPRNVQEIEYEANCVRKSLCSIRV